MKFRKLFPRRSSQIAANPRAEGAERRELLIVTRDQRFLSAMSCLVASHGWIVQWASSVRMARERLRSRSIPFVIYDRQASAEDWTSAVDQLRWVPEEPCIILAAEQVDESLWRHAIKMHVYDVVTRSLQKDHLVATLTFAWQKKMTCRSGHHRIASSGQPAIPSSEHAQ